MGLSRIQRALGALCALCAALGALAIAGGAAAQSLVDVRFGVTSSNETRTVFDLSAPAAYTVAGDGEGAGRIFVELGARASAGSGKGAGHIAGYRIENAGGGARVVLALGKTAKIKEIFVIPAKSAGEKTRLVVDVISADKAAFLASLPTKYEDLAEVIVAATAPKPPAPMEERPVEDWPMVVIDAGHGGSDPGAVGPAGAKEKAVTLAAALKLQEILKAKGRYRVVMTRTGDQRLSLEERMEAARDAGAELFVSIHADAHADARVRGGSVYTLSEAGSQRSTREALNQGDFHVYGNDLTDEQPDVQRILLDVTRNYTNGRSGNFADHLVRELAGVTPLVNNSHRTADLKVLLSPDVAAVLLELAFISNKSDETNLNSPAWREKTMTAVGRAVDKYFDGRDQSRHAASGAAEGAH